MYKRYATRFLIISFFIFGQAAQAMNMILPRHAWVKAERRPEYMMQLSCLGQFSFGEAKAYNEDGCSVNVLRMFDADQNALKMLDGFDSETDIGQRRIRIGANDDGVRGHFLVNGDLNAHGLAFSGRWSLPYNFSFAVHVPFYFMSLKNVCWQDQTQNFTADDARTKEHLTDSFFANVAELGDGLYLGGWERYGAGDLSLMFEWLEDFRQEKPFLKNVRVNVRSGLSLPSGKKRDEDKIFALPFGNDGAVAVFLGAGLDLTLGTYARAGLDVELKHAFGNTRCRRIKTAEEQTELLLLAKTRVFKDFALSQRFTLYAQGYKFWRGFSCSAAYQFFRRGDEKLCLFDHTYSEEIANTATSLQERTMHNMLFSLSYDFEDEFKDSRIHPYASVFVQVPFNGTLSAMVNSVGFLFSVDF